MIRLVLKGTNRTYDSIVTKEVSSNYSFALLSSTYKERVHQSFELKYLKSFGLVTEEGFMTNAGLLFADYCPLKHSRLYCTRWEGNEKDVAINDAEYDSSNILLLLREGMNFIKSNTRKGWVKLPDRRKNNPEYAERAVLEALVNHLIHRDYTVVGGEVHIDIYDNRLCFTSPGGMYNGKLIQNIDVSEVSSDRRNPVIADVMAQLDYMEKRGSGLKKICRETSRLEGYVEANKPLFKSSSTQFTTIIMNVNGGVNGGVRMTDIDVAILKHIRDNALSNNPRISEALGINLRKIERRTSALKNDYEYISYMGAPKNGGYILTEKGEAVLNRSNQKI